MPDRVLVVAVWIVLAVGGAALGFIVTCWLYGQWWSYPLHH